MKRRVDRCGGPPSATGSHVPANRWAVLALLGVAQLMIVLDVTIVNIALPSAQQALHFSTDDRQWIITAYALTFGSLLLLGGKLGDLFGRKWTFVVGLLGFAGASALGGLAPSFAVLVAARALQGAFGALLAPSALSLLTITFHDSPDRPKAFGIFSAIAAAGTSVGLLLRWRADPDPVLAVVPVREPALRHPRRHRGITPGGRERGPAPTAADRRRRGRHGFRRVLLPGLRVLQRRDPRLVGRADHHRLHGKRCAAGLVCTHRAPRAAAPPALAHRGRPLPRRRLRVNGHSRRRALLGLSVHDLLHAGRSCASRQSRPAWGSCRLPAPSSSWRPWSRRRSCPASVPGP